MTRQYVTRWIAVKNSSEHHCIHYGNPNDGLSYHEGWVSDIAAYNLNLRDILLCATKKECQQHIRMFREEQKIKFKKRLGRFVPVKVRIIVEVV